MSSNGASKSDAENTTREDLVLTSATRAEVSAPEETRVSRVETEAVDTHSGNENKERNNNPIIISETTAGHLDDTASSGLNRSTMSAVGQTGSIGSSLSSLSAAAAPAFSQHITSVLGMGRGGAFDYESVMNQVYLANMHTRQSSRTQSLPSESSADASSILEAALAQPNSTSTASQGGESALAAATVPALQIQQTGTALDPIREQNDDSKPPAIQRDAVNAALSFLQQHHGQTSVLAQHQVLQPQLDLMSPGRVGALLGGSGGIQRDSPAAVAAPAASTVRPTEKDVLFGRGKPILNHHGNRNMRKIADAHRTNYDRADRDDKTEITRMIVRVVKSEGGRFLKHDADLNGWVEVSNETARRKVAHAMRDGRTRPLGRLEPEDFSQPPSSTGSDRDSV